MHIYTIYDSKAETYLNPFYFKNKGEAIRAWTETVNDGKSTMSKYPEDFTLFKIGEFDENKATIEMLEAKESIGTATEYKQ